MGEIVLRGKAALVAYVDDDDMQTALRLPWYAFKPAGSITAYARAIVNGRTVLMHRALLGVSDPDCHVDHIDRDGLNNRRSNLRLCSRSQNSMFLASSQWGDDRHVQRVISRGRAYYYHRPTRQRLPDDPTSDEFLSEVRRLNQERLL